MNPRNTARPMSELGLEQISEHNECNVTPAFYLTLTRFFEYNNNNNNSNNKSTQRGATENAGLENSGPSKMQGWKTQDWKTRDHHSGGGKRDQ